MHRRLLTLLAGVTLLLAGCDAVQDRGSDASSRFVDDECADLVVLAARGQAQTFADGLGVELARTTQALVEALPGGYGVRVEAVPYPADRVDSLAEYEADVEEGVRLTRERHAELAAGCPDTRFAYLGFSEGANVMHRAAADPPAPDTIAVVAMIADPERDPDDQIRHEDYGQGEPTNPGSVGAGPGVAPSVRDRAVSLCIPGDEVCSAGQEGLTSDHSDLHSDFYEEPRNVRETTRVLVEILGRTLD